MLNCAQEGLWCAQSHRRDSEPAMCKSSMACGTPRTAYRRDVCLAVVKCVCRPFALSVMRQALWSSQSMFTSPRRHLHNGRQPEHVRHTSLYYKAFPGCFGAEVFRAVLSRGPCLETTSHSAPGRDRGVPRLTESFSRLRLSNVAADLTDDSICHRSPWLFTSRKGLDTSSAP